MTTQATKTHTTFPSFADDFRSAAGVTPLSYSVSDLTQILITNASRSLYLATDEQRFIAKSLHTYRAFDIEQTLGTFFRLFDDMFYFGLLKDKVSLEIRTKPLGLPLEETINGSYDDVLHGLMEKGSRTATMLAPNEGKPKIVILVFKTPYLGDPSNMDSSEVFAAQVRFGIGTMLHEMLHAFFDIYACKCWKRCHEKFQDPVDGVGLSGHGAKWCEAMKAIGSRAQADLKAGKLRVAFGASVGHEIKTSGWHPSEDQREEWGVSDDTAYKNQTEFVRDRSEYNRAEAERKWIANWLKDQETNEKHPAGQEQETNEKPPVGEEQETNEKPPVGDEQETNEEPHVAKKPEVEVDKAIIDTWADAALDELLKEVGS